MAAGPTGLQRRAITNHFRNAGGPLTNCYRLNTCIPPTFKCWSHNSQCDNIWRLWEVSRSSELNLYKWDLVLLEEERWERWSLSTTWGYSNKVAIVCKPGRSFSPHTTLNLPAPWLLKFLASGTVRNKCFLFKPLSLWNFVKATQAD